MQKTLPSKKVRVIIDTRELFSEVVAELSSMDCEIVEKTLTVGDYVCSDRVCIERKTGEDFTASIIDGRLFTQLKNIAEHYEKPVLIIEGRNFFSRNINPNAVYGALAACVDFGIAILYSSSPRETAKMIYFLAKREQSEEKRDLMFKTRPKPKDIKEIQLSLVAGLPFISATLAKRLLEKFKTPKKIFSASEEELKKVEGIGEKKARVIWKILNKEWCDEHGDRD